MKRNLLLLSAVLFFYASTLNAQVTKLSSNTSLNGLVLNGRIILISDVDNSLWTSDGTPVGTKRYTTDVVTSEDGGGLVLNNKVYFSGVNSANGDELWVTDGTAGGTSLIKDIVTGAGSSTPENFTALSGNTFLFFAKTAANGIELWKSDGTSGGTTLVKDINPGSSNSVDDNDFVNYAKIGTTIYFFADDGTHGTELWKTDGSTGGTQLVKDINPGANGSNTDNFDEFFVYNNTLLFAADDGTHGTELWKSDGSTGGTQLVKDIYPGANSSNSTSYRLLNNKVLFTATSSVNPLASNLWITDGTTTGTKLLNSNGPAFSEISNAPQFGNKIIFGGNTLLNGFDLWQTDGTEAGTKLFKDIAAGPLSSNPFFLFQINNANGQITSNLWHGKAYFSADDQTHGAELWETDGTVAGTQLLKDIFPGAESGFQFSSSYFTQNAFFFDATPSNGVGNELFKSDGTAAGTGLVKDINPGAGSSDPSFQFVFNNQLYFSADDGDGGADKLTDLFKVDANVTPLPVTLFDFAATLQPSQAVDLTWNTATEINTSHFEVERSTDGAAFSKITSIIAAGNSNVQRKYIYTDEQAAHLGKEFLYYRLKMVDKDGSYKYSGVLPIHMSNLLTFSLSPNPVADQLNVLVNTKGSHNIMLRITDASGKYLYQKSLQVSQDVYQHSINVASLHKGVYYIQVVTDSQTKSGKFVKP